MHQIDVLVVKGVKLKGVSLEVYRCLERACEPLTAAQIEQHDAVMARSRLAKSKARNHLARLVRLGFVRQVEQECCVAVYFASNK
jgi:hypothetical protein